MYRRAGKSRGQILIVVTVALTALIGAISLCTDVGVFYFNWVELQKAADAAVVAGANYLPLDPSTAVSTADNYARLNGLAPAEIASTQVSADNLSISMTLDRTVPYYFARVLGLTIGAISVFARATAETVGTAGGALPFGIAYQTNYSAGQTVTLMPGQVGAGNWSALALGGTGASIYLQDIENGYSGSISAGGLVTTETGVINGPTQQGINYRIDEGLNVDPTGGYADHTLTDPRAVVVPMVNFSSINGQSQVPVEGFAELWLVSVDGSANITTYFIGQVAANSQPSATASNFGAYTSVLTQ